jgi:hypothetical protein
MTNDLGLLMVGVINYLEGRMDTYETDERTGKDRYIDIIRLCPICGESMLIQVDQSDDTEEPSPRRTLALTWVAQQEWCHTICVENDREIAGDRDRDEETLGDA